MEAYVNNQQDNIPVEQSLIRVLEDVIKFVLENETIKDYEIGVTLVDDTYIQELNSKYRGKEMPTDVLSFPLTEEGEIDSNTFVVGDVVISLETAQRQSIEYGHSLLRETVYLLVHGIYHILGHTHDDVENKKVMRAKEDEVLKHFDVLR